MGILDEIKNEILKNEELDGNEKICLIALLCSSNLNHLDELAALMGVTRNTSQMTVRSLRMKGYLQDSKIETDEAEVTALRKLMSKEKPISPDSNGSDSLRTGLSDSDQNLNVRFIEDEIAFQTSLSEAEDRSAGMKRAEKLSKALDVNPGYSPQNSYKSRAAALYKKDSNVARAAKKIKDIGILDYNVDEVMESLGNSESTRTSTSNATENKLADSTVHNSKRTSNRTKNDDGLHSPKRSIQSEMTLSLEDRVMNLVEETITRSEAAIILGFAGGDYDKVEATYKRIRGTQIKDKVDALVKLLQAD